MMDLTILTPPNSTLRKKSKVVRKLDDRMLTLITDMQNVLRASKVVGAGLSAIQIGVPLRIFVARISPIANRESPKKRKTPDNKPLAISNKPTVFINPKIIWHSKELNTDVVPEEKLYLEGCLSVPKIYALIKRPWAIKVKYQTLRKNSKFETRNSKLEGFNATLIQHEIDHLNGILFTDRALEQRSQIYEVGEGEELHPVVL